MPEAGFGGVSLFVADDYNHGFIAKPQSWREFDEEKMKDARHLRKGRFTAARPSF
jgi:hypothetical protein